MASQISLGYHNLLETKHHNRAQEAEAIRANNLLDTRTREISALDRASRETIASQDRASREGIATLDRDSRFNIAQLDRDSREFVNERQLSNQRQIASLDRASREEIAALDRESREYMNDLQLQNALDRIQEQYKTNVMGNVYSGLLSGNPWTTLATMNTSPFIVAMTQGGASDEEIDDFINRVNNWAGTMELYAAMQALTQGAGAIGQVAGGLGSAIRGVTPNYSSSSSTYYSYSPSYTPQYSPRSYWGDSYHY